MTVGLQSAPNICEKDMLVARTEAVSLPNDERRRERENLMFVVADENP